MVKRIVSYLTQTNKSAKEGENMPGNKKCPFMGAQECIAAECSLWVGEHVKREDMNLAKMKSVKEIEAAHCSLFKGGGNVRIEESDF